MPQNNNNNKKQIEPPLSASTTDTLSRASNGSVQMETIVQHVSTGLLAPLEIVDEPDGHSSCGETTESSLSSAAASATAAAAVL